MRSQVFKHPHPDGSPCSGLLPWSLCWLHGTSPEWIARGAKAIATVNVWGFSYDSPNWEYKPEWAKFSIPKDTRMGIVKL